VPNSCFLNASSVKVGSGRLTTSGWEAASVVLPVAVRGSPLADVVQAWPYGPPLVDTVTGATCAFVRLTDGNLHCVGAPTSRLYFTDDTCTAPVGLFGLKALDPEGCATGVQHRVFTPGAQPGVLVPTYVQSGGGCRRAANDLYLTAVTEASASTFPTVGFVTE
jgi:hypothetical protein